MIKKMYLIIIGVTLLLVPFISLHAQEDEQVKKIQQQIQEYQKKLDDIRQQKNSLSQQIQFMDTQIYLTTLKAKDTEQKILSTQNEIEVLGKRIEGLDTSLDYLSKLFLKRSVASYKRQSVSLMDILLDSNNANELLNRFKYYKTVQDNNEKLVLQVQETKLNFQEQIKLRENKKTQLDQLNTLLKQQQIALADQKTQKQKLLADTGNDETKYQQLLNQAQRQLAGFKSFVQSSGASGIIAAGSLGVGSDGAYYSQRDERFATHFIGYSNETVKDVGCLLTSIAMFAKKFGQNVTPADIAADTSRFWGNSAWMLNPWHGVAGRTYSSVSVGNIDSELNNGNPVIVGVRIYSCEGGGNHFVLLTKKEGNDYIMHDPIYGPDLKFSSHYGYICSAGTFK